MSVSTWECYVNELTLGDGFGCVTRLDGALFCWGMNESENLPTSWQMGKKTYAQLGEKVYRDISANSDRVCGLTRQPVPKGTLTSVQFWSYQCWGGEWSPGETRSTEFLGLEAYTSTRSMKLSGPKMICGLNDKNEVGCWFGTWQDGGRQGNGVAKPFGFVTFGSLENGIRQFSTSHDRVCGVARQNGTIYCLEQEAVTNNKTGRTDLYVLNDFSISGDFVSVETGKHLVCGLAMDGSVTCEGRVFGDGQPHTISAICGDNVRCGFSKIAVGERHFCGIVEPTGEIQCAGADDHGQLEPGTRYFAPHGTGFAVDIASSGNVTCVVPQSQTTVICWGQDQEATFPVLDKAMGDCALTPFMTGPSGGAPSPSPKCNTNGTAAAIAFGLIAFALFILLGTVFCWNRRSKAVENEKSASDENMEETALVEGGAAKKIASRVQRRSPEASC